MISIQVKPGFLAMLAGATNQLPYAMSLALNRVAVDGQKAEQGRLKAAFHLRRETFVIRGIKIEKADRASKTSWRVVISIPVAQDFLSKFEEGDPKVPRQGKWLWIPNPAVFQHKIINRGNPLHPKQLHFQKSKGGQLQGDHRTFMIKAAYRNTPLVIQRMSSSHEGFKKAPMQKLLDQGTLDNFENGSKRMGLVRRRRHYQDRETRLLYRLVSRVVTPVRLEFVNTITNEVQAQWPERMNQAISEALRTAR